MRLAIADPPYPPLITERFDLADGTARVVTRSRARRWYGDIGQASAAAHARAADLHPDAGEWDDPARHRALLEDLVEQYDGWAIATPLDGLEHYRPLPLAARVLIWVKPRSMPTAHRIASTCEAVIVSPPAARRARFDRHGVLAQVPDVLTCPAPSIGFAGAKPVAWTRWVLDALGYDPDIDELHDVFPGSGAVSAAAAQGVLL